MASTPKAVETILVVYDSKAIRETVTVLGLESHFHVVEVDIPSFTAETIRRISPDLILLCALTRKKDIFDACSLAKATIHDPFLPLVFYTLRNSEEDRRLMVEVGADDVIPISLAPDDLHFRLRTLLRLRSLFRRVQRRIEFDEIVTSISTTFLVLPSEEIDAVYSYALRLLGEFLGIERAYLLLFPDEKKGEDPLSSTTLTPLSGASSSSKGGDPLSPREMTDPSETSKRAARVYAWSVEGVDAEERKIRERSPDRTKKWIQRLTDVGHLCVSQWQDLPSDFAESRPFFEERSVQSVALLPMVCGGDTMGILGLETARTEYRWPEELCPAFRLVAGIFAHAEKRKGSEEALRRYQKYVKKITEATYRRIELDELVTALSSAFISLPTDQIPPIITYALRLLSEFLGADRSYLLLFRSESSPEPKIYEWADSTLGDTLDTLLTQCPEAAVCWMTPLVAKGAAYFPTIEHLPPEAVEAREVLALRQVQSIALFPMICGDQRIGIMVMEAVRSQTFSPASIMQVLQMVAEMFSNVLARKQIEDDLRERSISLARASAEAADMILQLEEAHRRIAEQNEEILARDAQIQEQQKEIEKHLEILQRDLAMASALQISLLPSEAPKVPHLLLHDRYIPAADLGGDYFDYLLLPENRVYICIADVTGHGVAPALVSVQARVLSRAAVQEGHSLEKVLAELNRFMIETFHREYLMTMVSLLYDSATFSLLYAGAGHCPLIRLSADGSIQEFPSQGLPLGVSLQATYAMDRIDLRPLDRVLLYTDGITETKNPAGEEFGVKRLLELFVEMRSLPAASVIDRLVGGACAHTQQRVFKDDVTLVLLECIP